MNQSYLLWVNKMDNTQNKTRFFKARVQFQNQTRAWAKLVVIRVLFQSECRRFWLKSKSPQGGFYHAFPFEGMDSAELALPLLFRRISPWRCGSPNRRGSLSSSLYVHALCLFSSESKMCVCVCVCVHACLSMCVMYCISSRVAFLTGRPCRTRRALAALKSPCRTVCCFSRLRCCLTENHWAVVAARRGTSGCEWRCRHEDTEPEWRGKHE